MSVDLVRGPKELHVLHIHSDCFPDLYHVQTDSLDFVQIPVHFIVELCKPICYPELENTSCGRQLIDINGSEHSLCDVHTTGWFEAIVHDRMILSCGNISSRVVAVLEQFQKSLSPTLLRAYCVSILIRYIIKHLCLYDDKYR